MRNKKQGFTLVELIVVIVILAILATIAFLSFSSQSASARDSTRLADMSNISKGLGVYNATSGIFPKPDSNSIAVTASGAVIGYQGYAGTNVLAIAKLSSNGGNDPLDGTYYTYEVNAAQNKMQILGFLEDGGNSAISYFSQISILDPQSSVNADTSSYSGRFALIKGDQLGILLNSGSLTPVQAGYNATSFTGIDVVNTSNNYIAQFSTKDSISGSGLKLAVLKNTLSTAQIIKRDATLAGFWDMETRASDGRLMDISGNGNALADIGTTSSGGKSGIARSFDGSSYVTSSGDNLSINDNLTISVWAKPSAFTTPSHLVSKGKWTSGGGWDNNYDIKVGYDGCMTSTIGGQQISFGSGCLSTGQWGHVAIVATKTSLKSYYNGNLMKSMTLTGIPTTTEPLRIGAFNVNGIVNEYFKGTIDEIEVFNRALSDSEIAAYYNSTK